MLLPTADTEEAAACCCLRDARLDEAAAAPVEAIDLLPAEPAATDDDEATTLASFCPPNSRCTADTSPATTRFNSTSAALLELLIIDYKKEKR